MSKIVVRSLKKSKSAKPRARSVVTKRVRDAEGRLQTVYKLDANSMSFDEDFRYVFSRNVAKARKENRGVTGAAVGRNKR